MVAGYKPYIVVTQNGRTLTGILASETGNAITLRQAGGVDETILRREIAEIRSTGTSFMPEGMEETVTPAAMADLLESLLGGAR